MMIRRLHRLIKVCIVILALIVIAGCGGKQPKTQSSSDSLTSKEATSSVNVTNPKGIKETNTPAPTDAFSSPAPTSAPSPAPTPTPTQAPTPIPSSVASKNTGLEGRIICIDPGHQEKANYEPEPIAPGTDITKEKMSYGTVGVATGVPEYKLNLVVAQKLKAALEKKGAKVVMTRDSNSVNSGNVERAKMANTSGAQLVVRIHADGLDDKSVKGMSVLYPGGKYISDQNLLKNSKAAAQKIQNAMAASTGAINRGITERNDLTGFNWSAVPVILVEMGFMTNESEDRLLNTSEYQDKIVTGMVEGIEEYFIAVLQ